MFHRCGSWIQRWRGLCKVERHSPSLADISSPLALALSHGKVWKAPDAAFLLGSFLERLQVSSVPQMKGGSKRAIPNEQDTSWKITFTVVITSCASKPVMTLLTAALLLKAATRGHFLFLMIKIPWDLFPLNVTKEEKWTWPPIKCTWKHFLFPGII